MNTPIPWAFSFDEMGGYDCMTGAFDIVATDGSDIATIDLSDYGQQWCKPATDEQVAKAKANAALICRAVNSHESLVAALEQQITLTVDLANGYRTDLETITQMIQDARAALALAKGEA